MKFSTQYTYVSPWRRILAAIGFLSTTIGLGTLVFFFNGWNFIDSLYMVVITIFSVGYEEVHPISTPGLKAFVILLIVVGCTTIIYITGSIVHLFMHGELLKALGGRLMNREIQSLDRHVIICGFGRVGSLLAEELASSGVSAVVIDCNPEKISLAEQANCLVIHGDATDDSVLREAGIEKASYLAAVLPDDSINVFVTLSASAINPSLKIISRGEDPATEQKLLRAGAWKVVMPTNVGALKISSFITHPSTNEFLQLHGAKQNIAEDLEQLGLILREHEVKPGSTWMGRSIKEIISREENPIIVLAYKQASGQVSENPQDDTVLEEGDALLYVSRGLPGAS